MTEVEKLYLSEKKVDLMIIINDMMELQKGKCTKSDTPNGIIGYQTEFYGVCYEYTFTVIDKNEGCLVCIRTEGGYGDEQVRIKQMFSLIDSLLKI